MGETASAEIDYFSQDQPIRLPVKNHNYMTKEHWEGILQCKKDFLVNNAIKYQCYPQIDNEIILSWIRARKYGVDPYIKELGPLLSNEVVSRFQEKNQSVIDNTAPLFNSFKEMAIASSYSLVLIEKNGVLIHREGMLMTASSALTAPVGTVWNENVVGTNTFSFCLLQKRPVQMFGPLHYCEIFHNLMSSVAPIFDEDGEIIACLVLVQPLVNQPWEENFQNMCMHTMGLVIAMATAVENKLKLKRSYYNLNAAHSTLKTTLAFIDEGIITIDREGRIININNEGSRILKIDDGIKNKKITEFLSSQSQLMDMVRNGVSGDLEEPVFTGNDEQPYLMNIRLVFNSDAEQACGAVLRLNHAEKINAMVTSRTGATAGYCFDEIIGESKVFKKALALGKNFAYSRENILLIGESGTGKELFAQAIHNKYRPNGPFIAVNCAAMPRSLIESELFGYEGGSFTGAERTGRPGKIELANGGTLFLDEIGDMPFELQAVLLRVLEDKYIMRVGGRRYKKIDFRLIAATNKDLYKMVKEKTFREDLYFRLSVLSIEIPPLRLRGDDVEILAQYFLKNYCKKMGRKISRISPAAMKRIKEYDWPGNVRQLENTIIYAANIEQDEVIEPENLPSSVLADSVPQINNTENINLKIEKGLSLRELERFAIEAAMTNANNYVPLAADLLEISRSTLYRKLKEYNINQ